MGIPGVSEAAEVGNLTWACHNLWLIYRHRMDDALLRNKLFPLLRGAVNYYLHFLKEEADGRLHLPTTFSPEYGSAADCHYDLACCAGDAKRCSPPPTASTSTTRSASGGAKCWIN